MHTFSISYRTEELFFCLEISIRDLIFKGSDGQDKTSVFQLPEASQKKYFRKRRNTFRQEATSFHRYTNHPVP